MYPGVTSFRRCKTQFVDNVNVYFRQPSPLTVSSQYTHIMYPLGHPAYMKVLIILLKMIYIF